MIYHAFKNNNLRFMRGGGGSGWQVTFSQTTEDMLS